MRAFLVIHLCDKMPDAFSSLGNILVVIEVNFFRLESADGVFQHTRSPKDIRDVLLKSQYPAAGVSRDKHLKDIEPLDRYGGSPGRFGGVPVVAVSRSAVGSGVDSDAKL